MNSEKPAFYTPASKAEKAVRLLVLILALVIVYSLLNPLPLDGRRIHRYNGTYAYEEADWTLSSQGEILEEHIRLPSFQSLKPGQKYRISCNLTYDGAEDRAPYAFFYAHYLFCKAYLDGEEIFSYDLENIEIHDRSRAPGNIFASVPLPHDTLGKEFAIEFVPTLSSYIDFELPNTVFGDYATSAYYTFIRDMPHNIVIILSAFLGLTAIFFATLALSGSSYREGICIGIFALLFSLYNVTESRFIVYAISNPYLIYLINYITFSSLPIFLMAFLRERLNDKNKNYCIAFIIVGILLFFTELYLHFVGAMDMREFLPILHIWYFTEFLLITEMLVRSRKNPRVKMVLYQILPILAGMILDGIIYYCHLDISGTDAAFSSFGVVIFMLIEVFHVWKSSVSIYTQSVQSKDYLRMAYIDSLTGIGNRRAFEDLKVRLITGEITHESLIIISADLNNLKIANDSLGHAAGDYLIRSAANVLSDLAGKCGNSFRVGGDEFIVILHDLTAEELQQKLTETKEAIRKINRNSEIKLSIAMGYETVKERNLDDAINAADKKMYKEKARIKSGFFSRPI